MLYTRVFVRGSMRRRSRRAHGNRGGTFHSNVWVAGNGRARPRSALRRGGRHRAHCRAPGRASDLSRRPASSRPCLPGRSSRSRTGASTGSITCRTCISSRSIPWGCYPANVEPNPAKAGLQLSRSKKRRGPASRGFGASMPCPGARACARPAVRSPLKKSTASRPARSWSPAAASGSELSFVAWRRFSALPFGSRLRT